MPIHKFNICPLYSPKHFNSSVHVIVVIGPLFWMGSAIGLLVLRGPVIGSFFLQEHCDWCSVQLGLILLKTMVWLAHCPKQSLKEPVWLVQCPEDFLWLVQYLNRSSWLVQWSSYLWVRFMSSSVCLWVKYLWLVQWFMMSSSGFLLLVKWPDGPLWLAAVHLTF